MQCSSLTSCSTFTPNYWAPNKCANCYKPESAHTGDGSNAVRRGTRDRTTLGRKGILSVERKRSSSVAGHSPSADAIGGTALPPEEHQASAPMEDEQSRSGLVTPTEAHLGDSGACVNEAHEDAGGEHQALVGSGKKRLERRSSLSRMKHMVQQMVFKRKDSSATGGHPGGPGHSAHDAPVDSTAATSAPASVPAPRGLGGTSSPSTSKVADHLQHQHQHRLQLYKLRVLVEAELASQFPRRSAKEIDAVLDQTEPHLALAIARLIDGGAAPAADAAAALGRIFGDSAERLALQLASPSPWHFYFSASPPPPPPAHVSPARGPSSLPPSSATSATGCSSSSSGSSPSPAEGGSPDASRDSSPLGPTHTTVPSPAAVRPTSAVLVRSPGPVDSALALEPMDNGGGQAVHEYDQPPPVEVRPPLNDKVIVVHSMADPERWWRWRSAGEGSGAGEAPSSSSVSIKYLHESHSSSDDAGSPLTLRSAMAGRDGPGRSGGQADKEDAGEAKEAEDGGGGAPEASPADVIAEEDGAEAGADGEDRPAGCGGSIVADLGCRSNGVERLYKSTDVPTVRGSKQRDALPRELDFGAALVRRLSQSPPRSSEEELKVKKKKKKGKRKEKGKHKEKGSKKGPSGKMKTGEAVRLSMSTGDVRRSSNADELMSTRVPENGSTRRPKVPRSSSVGLQKRQKKSTMGSKNNGSTRKQERRSASMERENAQSDGRPRGKERKKEKEKRSPERVAEMDLDDGEHSGIRAGKTKQKSGKSKPAIKHHADAS